jgi:hypothetical protein
MFTIEDFSFLFGRDTANSIFIIFLTICLILCVLGFVALCKVFFQDVIQ